MKTRILFFSIFILNFTTLLLAQDEFKTAPINPDFVKYMQDKKLKGELLQTKDGYSLGEIPSPAVLHFENLKAIKKTFVLPTKYDLRTENGGDWLTPVKDQGDCGSCWTFATMGVLESYWLKQGLGIFDLSEQNMATCHGFESDPCEGGNHFKSIAYMSRGSGPFAEYDIPYTLPSDTFCISGYNPVAYVSEARFLPGKKDVNFNANLIKQAIVDNGALYINMLWDDGCYNTHDYTYFYNGDINSSTNHAILLVGWDDNKVVTGGATTKPSSPGAWIIRNSWGPNWGENGYFYVSYEDSKTLTETAYFPSNNNYNANATIYFYDKLGYYYSVGYSDGTDYGLVKYSASGNHKIEKIGTYIAAANTIIDIDVFSGFNGSSLSGQLGSLAGKVCEYPGYYTFKLPAPIEVTSGGDFYIRIKYSSGTNYPIPYEGLVTDYANPTIETGKCWISSNGTSNWTPIGQNTTYKWDLCIKAYAVPSCTLPAKQASDFKVDSLGNNEVKISWKRGEGDAIIVLAKKGSIVDANPSNGVSYNANSAFGAGNEIGTGNYVVYNGTGTLLNVTGLDENTSYHFSILEYNTSEKCYLVPGLTGSMSTTYSCDVISSFPYTQDFSTGKLPICWGNIDNKGSGQIWQFNNPGNRIFKATTASNGFAILDSDKFGSGGLQDADLNTPIFDFSGCTEVKLNFEHYYRYYSPSSATVSYSLDGGTTWIVIEILQATSTLNAATFSRDISLEVAGQSNVKFKWNYIGSWTYYWAIDDVAISVVKSLSHDLEVKSISPTFLNSGQSIAPKVRIANVGKNNESSYSVNLKIGTNYNETIHITVPLASLNDTILTMPVWTPAVGSYTLIATITLNGDENNLNNEASKTCNVVHVNTLAYGIVNYSPGTTPHGLCAFDLANPVNIYPIAEYNRNQPTYGGTWANGKWYGYDRENKLLVLDPITGETTTIGIGTHALEGLGYDLTSNTMYGVTATDLYTVNIANGSTTLVGSMGTSLAVALAINNLGDLYALDVKSDSLYKINKTTGEALSIGPIGFVSNNAQDLEFDNNTGILYYTALHYGTKLGELRTVNINTGATTLIGKLGDGTGCQVTGFAIPCNSGKRVFFSVSSDNNPIANASININNQIMNTNVSGEATIHLGNGEYNYAVTAIGYREKIDKVIVFGEDVHKNIALEKVETSIKYLAESEICIYPNPTDNTFTIKNRLEKPETYAVKIINTLGEVLYQKKLKNATEEISLSNFINGIYLLKIEMNGKVYNEMIILKK